MHKALFVIAFVASFFYVTATLAQTVVPSKRVVTALNVREDPSSSSGQVTQMKPGDRAVLVNRVPHWYEVRLPDGTHGYVSKAWSRVEPGIADKETHELRFHVLAVGAGSCVVIECPGHESSPIVVDCGSIGRGENGLTAEQLQAYVEPILSRYTRPARLVLTHPDADHYSHIPSLFHSRPVSHVWAGGALDQHTAASFPEWMASPIASSANFRSGWPPGWHNEGEPVEELSCGTASSFVLNVNSGDSKNANSLSLQIEHLDFSVLFLGDSEGSSESQIQQNFQEGIKANILLSAHHGSASHGSNSESFSNYLSPDVVIYSAGDRFLHPHCAAVNQYRAHLGSASNHSFRCGSDGQYQMHDSTASEYLTATNGTIVVTTDGEYQVDIHCAGSGQCGFLTEL